MRLARVAFAVLVLAPAFALAANAQAPSHSLTMLEMQVACGPPTTFDMPDQALHVIGSQEPGKRFLFANQELLVLDGGGARGLQLGQQFFVRRPIITGTERKYPSAIHTLGWLTIVSMNDKTALARVDYVCDAIQEGDYLDTFAAPSIPSEFEQPTAIEFSDLDFAALGRVLTGPENTNSAGAGGLVLIDRGTDQSVHPGARFAVYRDLHRTGMPLASVGEGVVLSVGKTMSLTKITRSRDPIITGDYVVPRK